MPSQYEEERTWEAPNHNQYEVKKIKRTVSLETKIHSTLKKKSFISFLYVKRQNYMSKVNYVDNHVFN